jgi:acetyltransferase-like isoleucine patch superfamily enzyme
VTDSVPGSLVRVWQNIGGQLFTRVIARSFVSFGPKSIIRPPLRLYGERAIAIGSGVFIGRDSWLQVLGDHPTGVRISIGDNTSIVGSTVISAIERVTVGSEVLMARNCYLADHSHDTRDPDRAVLAQGVTDIAPVDIGDGCWLGQNVVILPGTKLGSHCVVGANSVVRGSFPDHSVIVGAPARLVRTRT